MQTAEIIEALDGLGVTLIPVADALLVVDPQRTLTPAYRDAIRQHKPQLLALLRTRTGDAPAPAAVLPAPLDSASDLAPDDGDATPDSNRPLLPPCAVCGGTERWRDEHVWRCRQCAPHAITAQAQAAELAQAAGEAQAADAGVDAPDSDRAPLPPALSTFAVAWGDKTADGRWWLRLRDPCTGTWHEIPAKGAPRWLFDRLPARQAAEKEIDA